MAVAVGITVGVGSLLTTAGGGKVTVGAEVGARVAVASGTAVPTMAISVGAIVSAALTGSGLSSPPQATKTVIRMKKMKSRNVYWIVLTMQLFYSLLGIEARGETAVFMGKYGRSSSPPQLPLQENTLLLQHNGQICLFI